MPLDSTRPPGTPWRHRGRSGRASHTRALALPVFIALMGWGHGVFAAEVRSTSRPASRPSPTPSMMERFQSESKVLRSDPTRLAPAPPPEPRPHRNIPVIDLPPGRGFTSGMDLPPTATPSGDAPAPKSNFEQLGADLESLIRQIDWGEGKLSAFVQDSRYEITILDRNGDTPVDSGSAPRLLTAAAALKILGPDYVFPTSILAVGKIENGALIGNLLVRGSGDPSLSSRFAKTGSGDALSPFRQWARQLYSKGVGAIRGNLVGDDSLLDDDYEGPGWPEAPYGSWVRPEVSALTFNENLVDFHWLAGRGQGKRARYDLSPRLEYIQALNKARIDEEGRQNWRTLSRNPDSNLFEILGWIPAGATAEDVGAIHDPPAFFMTALKSALTQEGIKVTGLPMSLKASSIPDLATSGSLPLFVNFSPPLPRLLETMLRNDQALHAELVFKTLGRHTGRGGSFAGGGQAVMAWLNQQNLATPGSIAMDGSGLSRLNRLAPRQVVGILKRMGASQAGEEVLSNLPQGGQPGALAGRLEWSDAARAHSARIHAIPGFRPGCHTFAGWALTGRGRRVYFCFILNGSRLGRETAAQRLESLAVTVAQSPLDARI